MLKRFAAAAACAAALVVCSPGPASADPAVDVDGTVKVQVNTDAVQDVDGLAWLWLLLTGELGAKPKA